MLEQKPVVSWDFDGVLFQRLPAQAAVLNPFRYKSPLNPREKPIFWIERWPTTHSLSKKEISELNRHIERPIKPEVADVIRNIKGHMHVGNTGRPNNHPMILHTEDRLLDAGLGDTFDYIYFRPEGIESDESKYWALIELRAIGHKDITHYDDDARTVRRLADALPLDIKFVIVQDLTSGIIFSKKEMQKYPNVARVALSKGKLQRVYVPSSMESLPHDRIV